MYDYFIIKLWERNIMLLFFIISKITFYLATYLVKSLLSAVIMSVAEKKYRHIKSKGEI